MATPVSRSPSGRIARATRARGLRQADKSHSRKAAGDERKSTRRSRQARRGPGRAGEQRQPVRAPATRIGCTEAGRAETGGASRQIRCLEGADAFDRFRRRERGGQFLGLRLGGGAFFSSKKPRHHKTLHSYSGRKRDERSHRPGPKERTQHEAAFAACAPGIFRGRPSSISWGLGERRTSRPDRHRPRGRVGEGDPAGCSASAPFGRQLDPVRSHVQHAPMRDQRSSRCSLT
jgi:hypothetical protein